MEDWSDRIYVSDTITLDEEDVFQCGKCKRQFTSFCLFMNHKKAHAVSGEQLAGTICCSKCVINWGFGVWMKQFLCKIVRDGAKSFLKAKGSVVRKFPVLYGTWRFFTLFMCLQLVPILSNMNPVNTLWSYLRFIVIFSCSCLSLLNHLFPSGFYTKTSVYIWLFFNVCQCPSNLKSVIWSS
jgi:hypothetical protein